MNDYDIKDIKNADNVYRTKHFIVAQDISFEISNMMDMISISHDTFYLRNVDRDKAYEKMFKKRRNMDGKRLSATTSYRKYIY